MESKPDWIEVNIDMTTKISPANFKKAFGKTIKTVLAEDEKSSKLLITVVPLLKSDTEYASGRRGEVIIAAQSKRYKIIVVQQK